MGGLLLAVGTAFVLGTVVPGAYLIGALVLFLLIDRLRVARATDTPHDPVRTQIAEGLHCLSKVMDHVECARHRGPHRRSQRRYATQAFTASLPFNRSSFTASTAVVDGPLLSVSLSAIDKSRAISEEIHIANYPFPRSSCLKYFRSRPNSFPIKQRHIHTPLLPLVVRFRTNSEQIHVACHQSMFREAPSARDCTIP
ncbi:hypothetical protein [Burkholderia ubonensis]|uniref:hypothetical protein n=1 Tax=Burkholderia ubonensis TaxID=101571 RepID=UPI0018DF4981|nr:hypothetical protein [Burkholderia ubonensis]